MSDVEIEQKREEDERLDTAEDPNEEVRNYHLYLKRAKLQQIRHIHIAFIPQICAASLYTKRHGG
jgi:hypothetical protein